LCDNNNDKATNCAKENTTKDHAQNIKKKTHTHTHTHTKLTLIFCTLIYCNYYNFVAFIKATYECSLNPTT